MSKEEESSEFNEQTKAEGSWYYTHVPYVLACPVCGQSHYEVEDMVECVKKAKEAE